MLCRKEICELGYFANRSGLLVEGYDEWNV
eukprot:SAG31_NODE_880_length_11279_cov_154.463238_1_plen_30_part_00